jgi:hypothetical protein
MSTHLRILEHIQISRLNGSALKRKEEMLTEEIVKSIDRCIEAMKKELNETE